MRLNQVAMVFLGLALVCGVGRARAASFTLAGDAVAFEPPSGYCLLDPNEDGFRTMFDRSARMQQKSGNQLLAFFMVCDELSQIRHGQAFAPLHYGMLVAVLQGGTVKPVANATRFDLIESMRGTLKSDQMNDVMSSADDVLKQEGVVGTHLSTPAFADMDSFAIYSSSVIDFGEDPSTSTTGVYAITLVRHFVLATHMYAPTSDLGVKEALLEAQHALLADFVGRNESPEEQTRQMRTGRAFLGIDWGHVLVKAAIGAVAGGLIALVRTLIRRRRAKAS
jgi:hypothetical protein